MTQTQLQGRELDVQVALAMGWQVEWRDVYHLWAHHEWMVDISGIDAKDLERQPVVLGIDPQVLPFFSSDHRAAFELVDGMRDLGFADFALQRQPHMTSFLATFGGSALYSSPHRSAFGDTAAEAIARAALLALTEII